MSLRWESIYTTERGDFAIISETTVDPPSTSPKIVLWMTCLLLFNGVMFHLQGCFGGKELSMEDRGAQNIHMLGFQKPLLLNGTEN